MTTYRLLTYESFLKILINTNLKDGYRNFLFKIKFARQHTYTERKTI